jgi:hypothetical protein
MKHGQRGQSIFETALFVPLFLLSLYGIFVVVTEGSMSERVQLGVRNGGSIFAPGNPYLSYSSYNLYSSIDGVDPSDPSGNCNGALPDTTLLYASPRPLFFKPAPSASAPVASCVSAKGIALVNGAYYPLQSNFLKLSVQTGVSSYLVGKIVPSATLNTLAAENFIRPGSIGQLLQSSSIGAAVKASLEGQYDTTTVLTCTSPTVCPGFTGGQGTVPTPSPFPSSPSTTVTLAPKPSSTPTSSYTGPAYSVPGY